MFPFFRKKPRTVNLSIKEVSGFIDKCLMNIDPNDEFTAFTAFLSDRKEQIVQQIDAIQDAMPKEKNIPAKLIHLLQGNRKQYLQELSRFLPALDPPHDMKSFSDFYDNLQKEMHSFGTATQKSHLVLKEVIPDAITPLVRSIKEVEEKASSFMRRLEKGGIRNIPRIQDILKTREEGRAQQRFLKERLHLLLEEQHHTDERKKKIQTAIENIRKSERYSALLSLEARQKEEQERARHAKSDLSTIFAELERALKKFKHGRSEEALIDRYIASASDALLEDAELAILPFLEKLDAEIPALGLDKKKAAKARTSLKLLSQAYLEDKKKTLTSLKEELSHLERGISQNKTFLGLAEQENYLMLVIQSSDEINQKIQALQTKIKKYDEKTQAEELNILLEPLGGRIYSQ